MRVQARDLDPVIAFFRDTVRGREWYKDENTEEDQEKGERQERSDEWDFEGKDELVGTALEEGRVADEWQNMVGEAREMANKGMSPKLLTYSDGSMVGGECEFQGYCSLFESQTR